MSWDHRYTGYQAIFASESFSPAGNSAVKTFNQSTIWDPVQARFDPAFLPILATVPSIIALCVLLFYVLVQVPYKRPEWTRPFVEEPKSLPPALNRHAKRRLRLLVALFVSSLIGLISQIPRIVWPRIDLTAFFHVATWLVSTALIAVERPKTAPIPLLAVFGFSIAVDSVLLNQISSETTIEKLPAIFGLVSAFCAVLIILNMPLRRPELPTDQICQPFKTPTRQLRSPEDNLTVWQFMSVSWMAPLIGIGSKRQLNDEDVWNLAYEFQHRHLHDRFRDLRGSMVGRLFRANGLDLVIISLLSVLETVANFAAPVLLQQLLRSMEDPDAPIQASLTYAGFSLVVRLIAGQSAVFNLWFGRRAYERSRGEMITMLHEKTLSRKIVGAGIQLSTTEPQDSTTQEIVNVKDERQGRLKRLWRRTCQLCRTPFHSSMRTFKRHEILKEGKEPASKGKILNLMRNDVYEVAQRFWEFSSLITKPLGLIFAIVLVWDLIGWPCFFGVITIIIAQVLNAYIVRVLLRRERLRRIITDTKLQAISQVVESIRHLRWYGWQNSWLGHIMETRQRELHFRVITNLLGGMIAFTNYLASGLFPVAAFYAYTYLAGLPLRIDVAFPALQLFAMLENSLRDIPSLITVLLNARIAVGRINDFMNEEDVADVDNFNDDEQNGLRLIKASFSWPGHQNLVLKEVSLDFPVGMTVIYGKVAAGKSALLQALLGELDMKSGDYKRSDEMIGYCSQTPWLQNMSIRDNILFSSPYEPSRYASVLEACALLPDLATFKHGDLSDIGENGIGLSGGQKARVALARAVYSRASILLLDDPISALDYQTSKQVVDKCFGGPLMANRTLVLVTHRTELCRHLINQAVEVIDGTVKVNDRLDGVSVNTAMSSRLVLSSEISDQDLSKQKEAAVPEKFIEEERRAHGEVKASVYWQYIKAGKLKWWGVMIIVLILGRSFGVAFPWLLKELGEAYQRPHSSGFSDMFDDWPSPDTNVRPWLIALALIAAAQALTFLFAQVIMVLIVYSAGRQMFRDIMHRVCHATFRFYDVTPVGRLMNRLTSDINTIDGDISGQFQEALYLIFIWISAVVVIASVTPAFLIFSALLTVAFILIFFRFLPTSQSLRRLEMVSLSPLMSNFGALLDGLMTVRAFHAQYRFQDRVIEVTDAFQKMDHFYWSLQAWLMYRFDVLSACSTFILTLLAIYTAVTPGLTAFVLIAASKFVKSTHSLCERYGKLQMDFVSVERIVELLDLEQEPPGDVDPPASWPTFTGSVVFEDVTIRYSPNDNPALQNVSFKVMGGSTTAIVGRTGSGKSTLALALLATICPEAGRILVDGIDISVVNKDLLRSRVTFLAQDPVLFPGTMRQNLDPLQEHSDEDCNGVLQRVCGKHQWTLSTHVDTSGRNLSQGQRQLVGIARAVLRRSAIVILDEATASIDLKTSVEIQQILREEMQESTVITIAHRLEAVVNADYCIELSNGRVSKQGRASDLLQGPSRSSWD